MRGAGWRGIVGTQTRVEMVEMPAQGPGGEAPAMSWWMAADEVLLVAHLFSGDVELSLNPSIERVASSNSWNARSELRNATSAPQNSEFPPLPHCGSALELTLQGLVQGLFQGSSGSIRVVAGVMFGFQDPCLVSTSTNCCVLAALARIFNTTASSARFTRRSNCRISSAPN